jgi:hypothetical protein
MLGHLFTPAMSPSTEAFSRTWPEPAGRMESGVSNSGSCP